MSLSGASWKTLLGVLLVGIALYFTFFFDAGAVGLLGPDEPRFAAIGRTMAATGDWITPRLWGEPWFEKPALLYWLTGLGFRAGLSEDLAPRVPVAVLSCAFLLLYWRLMGWGAFCVLATSAGWVAFSQLGATDLPLSATYGAGMLLSWRGLEERRSAWLRWGGVCFGLAVLAKGLVPLVLALPLLLFHGKRWRELVVPAALGLAVALPWYGAMTWQHGRLFVDEFFLKHHFSRFAETGLAHVRPWWFYLPVLAGALFPWTPALLALRREDFAARTARFLAVWAAWGLVFFSASLNKLPGYLLPLLPAVCGLLGLALEGRRRWTTGLLVVAVLLLVGVPTIAGVLPQALASGLSRAVWGSIPQEYLLIVLPVALTVWIADRFAGRRFALGVVALSFVVAVTYLKLSSYPVLDQLVSARRVWRRIAPERERYCLDPRMHRNDRYGINYYAVEPLPECREDRARVPVER